MITGYKYISYIQIHNLSSDNKNAHYNKVLLFEFVSILFAKLSI